MIMDLVWGIINIYIGIPYILVIKPGHWSSKDLGLTLRGQSRSVAILAIILGIVTGSVAFINHQCIAVLTDPLAGKIAVA